MPPTVLIDTDMALDDWMAILYLLQSPLADVTAITIAATGEAHARPGARNALRLAALTDAPAPLVACGRDTPLRGNHRFPLLVRLVMDSAFFLRLPRPKGQPLAEPAVNLLERQINAAAGDVVLVALGPMTNIAELLLKNPALAQRITMIYQMGGALAVGGNLHDMPVSVDNPYAEWNIYIDPYAANVVMQSGAPLTLVPLDATNQVPLTADFISAFAAANHHPATDFVLREMRRIFPLMRKNKFYFWDVLAAMLATHPNLAQYETHSLRVITDEGRECGRVVVDPQGKPVRVCTRIDTSQFQHIFLTTLNQSSGGKT